MNNLDNSRYTGFKWIICKIQVSGNHYFPQALFSQDIMKVKASASGNINCINSSIRLNCSSPGENVIYKWESPNVYTGGFPTDMMATKESKILPCLLILKMFSAFILTTKKIRTT